jgi:hypothetical protein
LTKADGCPTRIVSDLPAEKDAFGSHERVARAVAALVRAEPGGKTIGLQGGWGSGKSTVVNLLKQELASDANVAVWVFDAWAHQGDPLRRTFLESLITYLTAKGWVQREQWIGRREELARRRRITESQTVPQLAGYGKLLIALLFLVPFGYILFSTGIDHHNGILYAGGALLLLAPLLVLARPYLHRRGSADRVVDDTSWALFVSKTITNSRTETIENRDPTSVEFESAFVELMQEALSDEKKRLILVLDNLDRVDPDDALSIWSTLQTFLQHGSHGKPDWFEKMWLVVPHDLRAIRRLWDREGSKSNLASSFLDKTFQVRFEVPPPVLSNWREYLVENLREALPRHGAEEFHMVYRVFVLSRPVGEPTPTPRGLKLYVNDIAALHRQHGDDFPLSHLAYYVALRQKETDIAKDLLEGKVPDGDMQGLLGYEVTDSLAALIFNVDIPLARQLLLRDPIATALAPARPDELRMLANKHPEGFWEILEAVVQNDRHLLSEPASLASAAYCLEQSELLQQTVRPETQTVRQYLRSAAAKIESWSPFNETMASGIVSLCGFLEPSAESIDPIIQGVSSSNITGSGQESPVPPETWADAVIVLIRGLKERGLMTGDRRVVVPANAEGWISVAGRIASRDPHGETWSFLSPQPSAEALANQFAQVVSSGTFSQLHAASLAMTAAVVEGPSWGPLVSAVSNRLQASNALSGDEVAALLNSLWELRSVEPSADSTLITLATEGHVSHHLHQAKAENNAEGIAACMFTYLHAVPSAATPPAVGNSQPGHETLNAIFSSPESQPGLVEAFVRLIIRYGDSDLPFTLLDSVPRSKPFIVACLRILAKSQAPGQFFTPEVVVARWSLLAEEFKDEEPEGLTRRLLNETDLLGYVRKQEFNPSNAALYNALVTAGDPPEKAFLQWCAAGLGSVSRDQWLSQLKGEGDLLELVLTLQRRSVKMALSVDYQDALTDHGQLVISGNVVPSRFQNWSDMLRPLTRNARTMFRRRLYDALVAANGIVSDAFFILYRGEICDADLIAQKRDAPYVLFTPLLTQRNAAGLSWLAEVLDSAPDLLNRLDSATVEHFRDRVSKEIAAVKGDEADEPIHRIAAALGIEPQEGKTASK